jgi:glucose/arabinose dehydrogenase
MILGGSQGVLIPSDGGWPEGSVSRHSRCCSPDVRNRIRDVRQETDGCLCVLTDSGATLRLEPE